MGKVIEVNEQLWTRLSDAAQRAGQTPERFVRTIIRGFLEAEADRALDDALRRAARSSGYKEKEAIRLVREYRNQLRTKAMGKVGDTSSSYRRSRRK